MWTVGAPALRFPVCLLVFPVAFPLGLEKLHHPDHGDIYAGLHFLRVLDGIVKVLDKEGRTKAAKYTEGQGKGEVE